VCVTINAAAVQVDITVIGDVVLAPDSPSAPSVGTLNQMLTFAPGRTKECLMINIIDDEVAGEADEQYRLSLQADDVRVMVMTPGGEADVIIRDDDTEGVVVAQFEQTSYEADENAGSIEVCVTINAAAVQVDITVIGVVVLAPDSPSAPSVGTLNQMLTFAPGRTKECLMINIIDDEVAGEADEQYRLSLQADDVRVMVMTPGGEADVIIRDDDTEGVVVAQFEQTSYEADEDAGSNAFPIEAVIGACVGGAVLAVIAAILCLLCLCVWRFYVKRRGFYHTNEDSQAAPTMLRYSASLRSISSQSVVVAEGKQATQKENEFFV
jgi:type IV secretory pathway VirJ component